MKIHLIRHGKTLANEQKLYCGTTDLPLSDMGRAELFKLKAMGTYPQNAEVYFTSGLLRTEQTIKLLYGSVERTALPELAEFDFGDFEMKSYEQLKDDSDYQAWIMDKTGQVACPNGENMKDFTRRICSFITDLIHIAENAVVVTHGGVIVCVMEYLFPSTRNFYEWQPEAGRGYTIDINEPIFEYKKI